VYAPGTTHHEWVTAPYDESSELPVDAESMIQVGISGPAASVLVDLGSIAHDLAFAHSAASAYAERAEAAGEGVPEDSLVAQALWNAAAISYRRAFTGGKAILERGTARVKLDREAVAGLPELSPEQQAAHTDTIHLADKHVAHRVDDVEGAVAVAYLAPPSRPRQVEVLGVLHVRFMGPEPQVARALADVCLFLCAGIEHEIETRRSELLAELRADSDVDRFYEAAEVQARQNANVTVGDVVVEQPRNEDVS